MQKACSKCGVEKPIGSFRRKAATKDGYDGQCKDCKRAWDKEWLAKRPTYFKDDYQRRKATGDARHRQLLAKFGLTLEQYNVMKAAQNNRCAICGDEELPTWKKCLAVDHDHDTGQVRELLCGSCNNGLGKFRDDPELLTVAAMYLRRHKGAAYEPLPFVA